ncbi:hypothetical protein C5167_003625 [Papaver somniferum]|uniref:Uncharacterized protein n=1 Tax=Papaver somniferum TaxID=3469 RepID=A0A4Y7L475_PAPSO|nr:uncharacterized protein LOC113308937 isoform X2 [Papaver somniferum]RZC79440.1 hypothetical protein C5167_003625 [Papaver somniferum]
MAVFVETNLNTRFAVGITDNDTVGNLKEKISSVHLNCFPVLGKINVSAIKVKRNKHLYQIPDSILVKIVFERVKGTWFLYVDATVEKSEDQIAHDPIGESMKEINHGENQLHTKQAVVPENLSVEKPLVNNDHVVKPVKKKKNPASVAAPSDLKRKLSEASPDTGAKDVSNTRVKKKKSIKISDGETGLLNSGARKDGSTSDVVPMTSKSEKPSVAEHPSLETKKAGKSLPPTGKSKKLKVKTIVASSSRLEKGSNKDCGIVDNSVNMVESSKTKQSSSKNDQEPQKEQNGVISRDLSTSTGENEKQGCTPL